jgi:hypothetical protein
MNYKRKITLGIGGVARVGKDSLCKIFLKIFEYLGLSPIRMALADDLKREIRQSLIDKYGIDVLNCTAEQKEIIRPDLVAYGKQRREESEGKYWTSIVEAKVGEMTEDIIIVPDIRYNQYPEDEAVWAKDTGILVHLERYEEKNGEKVYTAPANSEEKENDPLVKRAADFRLEWPGLGKEPSIEDLSPELQRQIMIIAMTYYGIVVSGR